MFYAENYSHSNVKVIGFGLTEADAILAGKAIFGFVLFQAKPSSAFFDEERGFCVYPESKGFPPATVGFHKKSDMEAALIASASARKVGSAGIFHQDRRGE